MRTTDAASRAATGVLMLGALAAFALLAFSLRHFAGSMEPGALVWYLAFATASAALAWSALRLNPPTRLNLALACVAVSLTLYGTEVAMDLAARVRQFRMQDALAARTGIPVDRRTVPDVVAALRDSGVAAVPSVVPFIVLHESDPGANPHTAWRNALLPLAGIASRTTVQLCREGGRYRRYESDEHGFMNPPGTWSRPSHHIVLIGDSFTHGYCVDPDSSYAGQVRRTWPDVLNLGTAGSGPLLELATLTEYAAPYHPKIVVWQYYANDFRDLALERQHDTLLHYRERGYSQGLLARQPEVDAALTPWVEQMLTAGKGREVTELFSWHDVATLLNLRELVTGLLRGLSEHQDRFAELPLFRAILHEAADRVHGWGGELYFVVVPEWERYYTPGALAYPDVRDSILSTVRSLALPIVDLDPVVRNHPHRAELYGRRELATGHFSVMGYDLMAREVVHAIEDRTASGHGMPPTRVRAHPHPKST